MGSVVNGFWNGEVSVMSFDLGGIGFYLVVNVCPGSGSWVFGVALRLLVVGLWLRSCWLCASGVKGGRRSLAFA